MDFNHAFLHNTGFSAARVRVRARVRDRVRARVRVRTRVRARVIRVRVGFEFGEGLLIVLEQWIRGEKCFG
eukprot:1201725-Amorphochlora_amoeboformis.AAC.1